MLDTTRINDIRNPADRAFYLRIQELKQEHMHKTDKAPRFIYFGKQEWEDFRKFAERNWMVNIYSHGANWIAGLAVIQLDKPFHMEVSHMPTLHCDQWVSVQLVAAKKEGL